MISEQRIFWNRIFLILIGLFLLALLNSLHGADWPQWNGIHRDGKSTETGLLKEWPEGGPKMLWSEQGIGKGFSSPSISNGTLYITGIDEQKMEFISAMDLNGKLKWRKTYGQAWDKSFPEARTTPAVDDKHVYVISGQGKVVCFDAQSGAEKWAVDALTKFAGKTGKWGVAESPLIVADKVIFTPGGNQTTVVALNKLNGETVWTSKPLNYQAGYVSPILIQQNGKEQIVAVTGKYILGVNPENGAIEWNYDYLTGSGSGGDINTNSPVFLNGEIYVTSGYNHFGVKLKLADNLSAVTRVWTDNTLDVHHGGVVLVDDYLYGANWLSNSMGNWVAVNWATGKPSFEKEWYNKGSIIYADGMLYCFEEKRGHIALVKAVPHDFAIVSSFQVPMGDGPAWAHPVISDGRLYVRRGDALMVYEIKS